MSFCGWPATDENGLTMPPFPADAMRLGFPVKVMGRRDLKSNDTRRWQQNPHLRVSLGYLCEIFAYLRQHDIRMYRMSSDLAPYATHPDMPQFHSMVEECRGDLDTLASWPRAQGLRLSFHPSQYIVLNSGNADADEEDHRGPGVAGEDARLHGAAARGHHGRSTWAALMAIARRAATTG